MTETITDTDEIEELAYQILDEQGKMNVSDLLFEFHTHDTDAPVQILKQALHNSDRVTRRGKYWGTATNPFAFEEHKIRYSVGEIEIDCFNDMHDGFPKTATVRPNYINYCPVCGEDIETNTDHSDK